MQGSPSISVVVTPGRMHSVAPPPPVMQTLASAIPEAGTGIKEGVSLALDPALEFTVDDTMLSSRSRRLAMELRVRV